MKWTYWMSLYTQTHCMAKGLSVKSIRAYHDTLKGFRQYVHFGLQDKAPDELHARDILEYIEYLRSVRRNGDKAVNRQVTVIRCFYRAIVAMGYLEPHDNPMAHFPTVKAPPRKLRDTLSKEEVSALISQPRTDTVLGLRDRAIFTLLYGTGIRVGECEGLKEKNVDLQACVITVKGKGGHERTLPLNQEVANALAVYRRARGEVAGDQAFFRSRRGRTLSRNAIYERVRTHSFKAGISKKVSPHTLRHTFATHLIRAGENLVVLKELLGHRQISSTQIYLHMTAEDLKKAVEHHPIEQLMNSVSEWLPHRKLPFQYPPGERFNYLQKEVI